MKILINTFIIFALALLMTSCVNSNKTMATGDNSGGDGSSNDVCTDQTFDVSSIDTFNKAMDVARAADTLKLNGLKSKALVRAGAIFDAKVADPGVSKDDPAIIGFSMDPDAASFIMMKCGKAMDLYNRTKIENDVVEALKLKTQRAGIDVKLLMVNTDIERAKNDAVAAELVTAQEAAAKESPAPAIAKTAGIEPVANPFFCVPCSIILGVELSGGAFDKRSYVDIRISEEPVVLVGAMDAEFVCDSKELVALCETLMSGGLDNPDPCGNGNAVVVEPGVVVEPAPVGQATEPAPAQSK